MLRIAICGADPESCYTTRDAINNVLAELGEVHKTEIFFEAEKLFKVLRDKIFDYIICDVLVGTTDMIDFAQSVREERRPLNIVFFADDLSDFQRASEVFPLAYLEKSDSLEKLEMFFGKMFDYVSCFRGGNRKFYVSAKNGEKYLVDDNDIIYIEVFHNDICIHMENEKLLCRSTLGGFLKKLPAANFVRCHHSYAVNLSKVREIKRYTIDMFDGSNVPVSKQNYFYVRDRIAHSGR